MSQTHEWMFYELAWRQWTDRGRYPLPFWCQQYFRAWSDEYDSGLFSSKESAFASNAHYRYWHMVGVKDHHQESLIGQAGEVEPVYDHYAINFFLFDPAARALHLPQFPSATAAGRPLSQAHENGYLPIVHTRYSGPLNLVVDEEAHATVLGSRMRSVVLVRFVVRALAASTPGWLCVAVSPAGPTGFQRHDKAGRYAADKRIALLRYDAAGRLVAVNGQWGPIFRTAPTRFGIYGNPGGSNDPAFYLNQNPYRDLTAAGALNGSDNATDFVAGLCAGVFAWDLPPLAAGAQTTLDLYLPVDDYRGDDLAEFHAADPDALAAANRTFWTTKLDAEGTQVELPAPVAHIEDLYRVCRANLLILGFEAQWNGEPG